MGDGNGELEKSSEEGTKEKESQGVGEADKKNQDVLWEEGKAVDPTRGKCQVANLTGVKR
jgi:hypothetical protein